MLQRKQKDYKFNCETCQYSIKRSSDLNKHIEIHLKTPAEKEPAKTKCDFCDYRNTNKSNFNRHLKLCSKKQTSRATKYRHLNNLKRELNIKEK